MAIDTNLTTIKFAGTGLVKRYTFPSRIADAANLKVYGTRADNSPFEFVMGQDYSVATSKNSQGFITSAEVVLTSALPINWHLIIRRELPLVQETNLSSQGPYSAAVVEGALDYSRMVDQQLAAGIADIGGHFGDYDAAMATLRSNDAARQAQLANQQTQISSLSSGKADKGHTHALSEVTGLPAKLSAIDTALDGKSASGHKHTAADVTDLQGKLDAKANASDLANYATTTALANGLAGKSNTGHSHTIADVSELQAMLNGKAAASHDHAVANVTGLQDLLNAKASMNPATTTTAGLMSAADKTKLDGIQAGGGGLPAGGNVNDMILNTAPGQGAWTSPTEFAKKLPYASAAQAGVIKVGAGLAINASGVLSASGGGGEPGTGTSDHAALSNRDASDQHPVEAISGLAEELAAIDQDLDGLDAAITAVSGALDGKAPLSHNHAVADVSGLQTALDAKAPTSHTQAISSITGLQAALDAAGGGPHTHEIADVTGLESALNRKAGTSHFHALIDVGGLQPALDAKAPLASPALTGTPTAPTPAAADNSNRLATTAYVDRAVSGASGLAPGMLGMFMQIKIDLPAGWYYPSGDYVAQSSPVGQALVALPTTLKSNWGITTSGSNIRLCDPSIFFIGTMGRFPRPVNGANRLPGTTENDAIRDIIGAVSFDSCRVGPGTSGAFTIGGIGNTNYGSSEANISFSTALSFKASNSGVPTATENRPYNFGYTPAIYLGV